MRKPLEQTEELIEVLKEGLKFFDQVWGSSHEAREMSLYERRMVSEYGAQYEGALGEQFENKPKPEFNKIKRSCKRMLSELRNSPITVDYISKDGSDKSDLAGVCDDLYRSDEQDSVGDEAYDLADDEAIKGGMGAYRFIACDEDEYDEWNDHQRIRIEPIPETDQCVFFCLNSKRYDKADAKRCMVLTALTRDSYLDEWGDDPTSWPKSLESEFNFSWSSPDLVYVAEFYKVDETKEKIYVYESLEGDEERYSERDFDNDETLRQMLEATGWKQIDERSVKRRAVRKYIMSGGKVLDDCGFIAGPNIPIAPQYGDRSFINGVEVFSGHVRAAKDPQQLYNAIMSMLMDLAARGLKEKPIFDPEQIDEFSEEWRNDNIEDHAYLRAKSLRDDQGNVVAAGPIGSTKAPEVPPALAALIGIVNQDLNDILGEQPQAEKMVSNVSGKLAEMVQSYKDLPSFMYASNRAKTRRRGGEIWLGMAKELYVEIGRKMKAVSKEGKVRQVTLNEPAFDENGEFIERNCFADAGFDVYSDVGPSTASKREKILQNIQGFLQYTQNDPELMRILTLFAMKNFEGDEVDVVRDWADKKFMEMGGREPTEEESKEMAEAQENAPPNPESELLLAEAGNSKASAELKEAKVIETYANVEKKQAETAEVTASIDRDDLRAGMEANQPNGIRTAGTNGRANRIMKNTAIAEQAEEQVEDKEEIPDSQAEQETEEEQPEAKGETPEQTETDAAESEEKPAEEESEEGEELVIEIEGESPTQEDEKEKAETPQWVKDTREKNRELNKKLKQREKELDELREKQNPNAGKLRQKPTLEDHDFDGPAYEADLEKWIGEKSADSDKRKEEANAQKAIDDEVQSRIDLYKDRKASIGKRISDYDEHVAEAEEGLSELQRHSIAYYFKESAAEIMYVIGKQPDQLEKLSKITDPTEMLLAVKDIQSKMKVSARKPKTKPETIVEGQSKTTNGNEAYLERLEKEAAKTGDRTKITAFKREQREKARNQ
jgi:hypothetical protein